MDIYETQLWQVCGLPLWSLNFCIRAVDIIVFVARAVFGFKAANGKDIYIGSNWESEDTP